MDIEVLQGQKVLLVEDESLVAMLAEDMLADLGADVVLAMRFPEGLHQAQQGEFALAVLDVNLGGGHRSDPIADILAHRGVPFLFVTGYGERGPAERHAGKTILQKPYHASEFGDALARALDD
ncbi:response regulator [uncultured Alsobacter sp.]|uniref:response regulator n=1 Tax=uncultured Alsobacter sp. TaxID=1748258 RepID=UPI0025FA567F|nr:response regulator [uncultured Alsobacter sp.]